MSFNIHDDLPEISEINMTPLVDVMLVLLIIFIITMPVITHSVKVDLPQASNQPTEIKPNVLTLTVQQDGTLLWNNEKIALTSLQARLQTLAQQSQQPELHIQGDKAVQYGKIVEVMAAAQRAGIEKLGFVTKPEASSGSPSSAH